MDQEKENLQEEQTIGVEEFPEGSYGEVISQNRRVENKTTPWKENQRKASAFTYEFKRLHENVPRHYPGAHPTHDEKEK